VTEKHCRYCQRRIPSNRDWHDNYCCDDHRTKFQERQHSDTIERLRREETLENELQVHTFEPRRVRVAMLAGSDSAPIPASGGMNASLRPMPPKVHVQPLVAPPLQPKAPVEQSLAALSRIAEPVSQPLEIPAGYLSSAPAGLSGLGASVRRPSPSRQAPPPSKNEALVNFIRSARERAQKAEASAAQPQAGPAVSSASAPASRVRPAVTKPPGQASAAVPMPRFLEPETASEAGRLQRWAIPLGVAGAGVAGVLAYFFVTA
jgi:hypothetical protein